MENNGIAAIQWTDTGGVHIRTYSQDRFGSIVETCTDGKGWFKGQTLGQGAPGTGIAAIVYDMRGTQLRVYFTDASGQSIEMCLEPGGVWHRGAYPGIL